MSTKIEWVLNLDGTKGRTWNPITGCSKISRGCVNCYAERMSKRLAGRYGYPKSNPFRVTLRPNRLLQPLSWKKPSMIFLCSMSDLFHPDVPDEFIFQIIDIIKKCPHHTFQILTKRPNRMIEFNNILKKWPDNAWVGVTVEASLYKHRIEQLRKMLAPVKYLSCEPLLDNLGHLDLNGINWVIVGGESGSGARPMESEWATNIRDQCLSFGVPYFFKQWGGMFKKKTGRELEGKVWNQMPFVQ